MKINLEFSKIIPTFVSAKQENIMLKYSNNWGGLSKADNATHDEMYDKYVPACGKAATLGGEILRAINRIIYKFYNDGDTTARYYSSSYNHSYGAELFLEKYVPGYDPTRDIMDDAEFEEKASQNLKRVLEYLKNNPALFETVNNENFLDLSPEEEWDDDDYDEDYDDEWDDSEEE